MRGYLSSLAFCLIFAIAGCSKPEKVQLPTSPQPAPTPGAGQGPTNVIDACSLLTSKQIETIQGAPLKDTKPSANSQGGLAVSQCSFLLPPPAESIVVTVTQRDDRSNSRDPKQLWEGIFHGVKEKAIARKEEENKSTSPEKVDGLGDEAFWVPKRFDGKLYALKGNIYISISVGGPDDQATKLQKSKALAEIVLKRL
jgi:hypothetical protein